MCTFSISYYIVVLVILLKRCERKKLDNYINIKESQCGIIVVVACDGTLNMKKEKYFPFLLTFCSGQPAGVLVSQFL